MNNSYHFIKDIKRISALLAICILCFVYSNVRSQSVNISVNITPPYSPFYSDYAGINASKVLLTLQNLTNTTKNIKLTGQLEGDNGIRITTKSNYVPLQPIVLNPNQVKQLNGLALKDIFDLNTLNVYGVDKVKLVQTSRLPEGNYTFCIQAVDMATNQVISSAAPLGCTTISITYPDAPILISPLDGTSLNATKPQSVLFNWINAGFVPLGTQYILQLAEMPQSSTNPDQVLNGVSFPLINRTLSGFSYVLSPADPPLVIGKKYAWRVKAIDPTGKVVFKNNGISKASTFSYQTPISLVYAPTLISPENETTITDIDNGLPFKWAISGLVMGGANYNLQVVELPSNGGNAQQLFDAGTFVVNKTVNQLSHTLPLVGMPLINGKRYAWRVIKLPERGRPIPKDISGINLFNYKAIDMIAPPILLSPSEGKISPLAAKNTTFRWKKSRNITGNFEYTLQLLELPAVTTNPAPLFNGNTFLVNKTTSDTSFISTLENIVFKIGKRYAWRVKMKDPSGKYQFRNNGISEISTFDCADVIGTEKLPAAPIISSPTQMQLFTQLDNLTQPAVKVAWSASVSSYPLTYRVIVSKIPFGVDPKIAVMANLQPVYEGVQTGTQVNLEGRINQNPVKANTIANLEEGGNYAVQVIVEGKDDKGGALRFDNLGRSNVVQFTYKEKPKEVVEPPAPTLSTITGRFLYRYKETTDYPKNSALGFSQVVSKQVFGSAYSPVPKFVDKVEYNDYPDYTASNRFPLNGTEKPLKNVEIKFTYTLLQSSTRNPQNYTNLEPVGNLNSSYELGKYLDIDGEKILFDKVISSSTVRLKDDGSFSLTFTNKFKLGYIGTKNGKSYFGVIRPLIIDKGYYTSSEMLIFPKVGKTTKLPDEVVFAYSYDVELKLATDKTIKNQVVDPGKILSNYPVNVLDYPKYVTGMVQGSGAVTKHTDMEDDPLTVPIEANADSYIGQTTKFNGADLKIATITKTELDGIARVKNLLPHHSHMLVAALNPFEGNYNYKPAGILVTSNSSKNVGNLNDAATFTEAYDLSDSFSEFSSDFKKTTVKAQLVLKPKKPEIYLRAVTVQNGVPIGIPYAYVTITSYKEGVNFKLFEETFKTDDNGYLHLTELQEGLLRTIVISKYGYQDKQVGATKQKIQLGERFPASVEQEMKGGGTIAGFIVNEKGEPITANVRVAKGPFVKSNNNGFFVIENVADQGQAVEIIPVVDNYFSETVYPYIKPNDVTMITTALGAATGKIVLKEKLHRVKFKIVDQNDKPIRSDIGVGGSTMSWHINDPYTGLTDEIAFASPDEEFKVRVVANGYVTYDDYVKIAVSKNVKLVTIKLSQGQIVTGTVKDVKTGAPIANARVYTVSGTNEDGEIQNFAYTDSNGKYTLYGAINPKVWVSAVQFFQDMPIKVYAVKSGEPGYIMEAKTAVGYNGKAQVDFNLLKLNQKSEIWGLPIEVHSLTQINANTMSISGAFTKLPANNNFKVELADAKLPFANQVVKQASNGGFSPATLSVEVQRSSLKIRAYDQFSCEVIGSDQENNYANLRISYKNEAGTLMGYVTSELASFNFSYNYNGKFLLGSGVRVPGKGMLMTPSLVFSSNPSQVNQNSYRLHALYGKSSFKVHNFVASLQTGTDSYLDKAGFNIAANVNLNIPLVGISTMPAGQFKVSSNNIVWSQYTGNINIPLEKWELTGKGLMYEINQGGFRVLQGSLKTDLPQVALTDLLIMPTSIDLGATNLTGKENLSLANVTPLKLAPGARMTLNYDAAASFDQKPHYRLNLSSPNKSVAHVDGLPGMGTSRVNINMLSTYSDGQHKTILVEPTKVNYFNVVSQTVTGIEVAKDFFTLIGNTNLEIPGASANVTGRFKYFKNPADQNADANGVVLNIEKLQTDVEMEGKVKFEGLSYKIKQNLLEVDGNVYIYKNTLSDAIKGIKGRLTKQPNEVSMRFLDNQKIMMGSKSMLVTQGGSSVQGNKWQLVKFTGKPTGYGTAGKDLFTKDNNLIDFEIKGAIENVKSGKKVQLEGINTPFGDLSITFDFSAGIFNGSLEFRDANIVLGYITVQDGAVDLQMDNNGVLLVGTITNAAINAPLPSVLRENFKSGIALGYYDAGMPTYMANKLLGVTLYSNLPPPLNKGLKGFYINIMKSLSKDDLPKLPGPNLKSIPVVGSFVPVFDFFAGVDMYLLVDFNDSFKFSIGGQASASASCYYDLEFCTIGASASGYGNFALEYLNSNLTGKLDFGLAGGLSYCVGNLGVSASLLLSKDANGFNFKPSLK